MPFRSGSRHLASFFRTGLKMHARWASQCHSRCGAGRVKREALLRLLRFHGCFLKRERALHSMWTNPLTGQTQAVSRHTEIAEMLARKSCAICL